MTSAPCVQNSSFCWNKLQKTLSLVSYCTDVSWTLSFTFLKTSVFYCCTENCEKCRFPFLTALQVALWIILSNFSTLLPSIKIFKPFHCWLLSGAVLKPKKLRVFQSDLLPTFYNCFWAVVFTTGRWSLIKLFSWQTHWLRAEICWPRGKFEGWQRSLENHWLTRHATCST